MSEWLALPTTDHEVPVRIRKKQTPAHDSVLHCTETFLINILPSSRYGLDNVEWGVKHQIIIQCLRRSSYAYPQVWMRDFRKGPISLYTGLDKNYNVWILFNKFPPENKIFLTWVRLSPSPHPHPHWTPSGSALTQYTPAPPQRHAIDDDDDDRSNYNKKKNNTNNAILLLIIMMIQCNNNNDFIHI